VTSQKRLVSFLAALWAGSLLAVCAIAAPTAFATLDDRRLAGAVAGRLFQIETWVGVAFAGAIALLLYMRGRAVARVDAALIALTAGAPLASEVALGPLMQSARAAGDTARFGVLHGAAALLFALACLGALALAWRLSRPEE
jgi:Domain of unknown function (DUF4149)